MIEAERRKIPEVSLPRGGHGSLVREPGLRMKRERKISKLDAKGCRISLKGLFDHFQSRPAHRALQVGEEFNGDTSICGPFVHEVVSDFRKRNGPSLAGQDEFSQLIE